MGSLWRSEAELCAAATKRLLEDGWIVYPETGGADLLAVAGSDCRVHRPDVQVAVQAKLYANVTLLRQCLWPTNGRPHADYHVALSGAMALDFFPVAERLGINYWFGHDGELGRMPSLCYHRGECNRIKLPEIIPDVKAGVPGPLVGESRRIASVRLMLRLRDGELLTSRDFKEAGVLMRPWQMRGWIKPTGQKVGRLATWTLGIGEWDHIGEYDKRAIPPDRRWPLLTLRLRQKDAECALP